MREGFLGSGGGVQRCRGFGRSFTRGSFGYVEWVEGSEGEQSAGVVCVVGGMYCIWKYGKGRVGSKQFGGRTMGPCKGRDVGSLDRELLRGKDGIVKSGKG
jgi:hypothetical protein